MKRLATGGLVCLLAATICFCVTGFAAAQEKSAVTLRFSTLFPATHKMGVMATEWGKDIEKRTNGAVKVTVFHSGSLTPPDKAYDGVVKGISDVAMPPLSYTVGKFPLFEVFDYPMNYKNSVVATRLANDVYNKFKPKEFDEVKVLFFVTSSSFGIHSKKPVSKLEDLKGLKIRSSGVTAKIVSRLGGTPVGIPIMEVYDGINRGVIDGVMSTVESLQGWKFAETAPYTVEGDAINVSIIFVVAMNKAKWNAFPPNIQAAIEEVNKEYILKSGHAWDEMEKASREFSRGLKHNFVELSATENARWLKQVDPLFDEYVKEKTAIGLPAAEVLNFCQDQLKKAK